MLQDSPPRTPNQPEAAGQVTAGSLRLDTQNCVVYRRGLVTKLGPLECKALQALIEAGGRPVTIEDLLGGEWGGSIAARVSRARSVVRRLRGKLQDRHVIQTIGNEGYRLNV